MLREMSFWLPDPDMLPRAYRLPSPEITSVMRAGRRAGAEGVQLVYLRRFDSGLTRNLQSSRFAFVVPVGVDKRATRRNRVRRLVRESVRLALPNIAPGWDGVFMVRKGLGDEFARVDRLIRELLRKSGLLNESKIT